MAHKGYRDHIVNPVNLVTLWLSFGFEAGLRLGLTLLRCVDIDKQMLRTVMFTHDWL